MPLQTVQTQVRLLRLTRVFPICYSDKHFVNSNPDNEHYLEKRVRKLNIYRISLNSSSWEYLSCLDAREPSFEVRDHTG